MTASCGCSACRSWTRSRSRSGIRQLYGGAVLSSPLHRRGRDLRLLDTWKLRRAPSVAYGLAVHGDDRLGGGSESVLGDRWFLGKIFWYDPAGPHFGVPISNYLGWYFVAAVTIAIFVALDSVLNRGDRKPYGAKVGFPSRALLGPAPRHRAGITMLFESVRAESHGLAHVYLPAISGAAAHIATRHDSYGETGAIEAHLRDFPYERAAIWGHAEVCSGCAARRHIA